MGVMHINVHILREQPKKQAW